MRMEWSVIVGWIMPFLIFLIFIFLIGIRIVRPTEKGLIERLGKYKKTAEQGFHWIIPRIRKSKKAAGTIDKCLRLFLMIKPSSF